MTAVRLVATDLDGTLLRSDGIVSPRTVAAVRAALDAGLLVVPATGRPRMVATDVMAQLPELPWWIFANGSVTWHAGHNESIRAFYFEPGVARDLVAALRRAVPGCGLAIEFPDSAVFESGFERLVPQVPTIPPSEDVLDHITDSVQKVLVFHPELGIDELYRRSSAAVGGSATAAYSGLPFIELATELVTKATALELLAADLGFEAAQVAALGDNHNDLPMLGWAGRSYAMANATDDALATADQVIGHHDDDAVAEVLEQLTTELLDQHGGPVPLPD